MALGCRPHACRPHSVDPPPLPLRLPLALRLSYRRSSTRRPHYIHAASPAAPLPTLPSRDARRCTARSSASPPGRQRGSPRPHHASPVFHVKHSPSPLRASSTIVRPAAPYASRCHKLGWLRLAGNQLAARLPRYERRQLPPPRRVRRLRPLIVRQVAPPSPALPSLNLTPARLHSLTLSARSLFHVKHWDHLRDRRVARLPSVPHYPGGI